MYDIGICDDGENICSSIENMISECAKEKAIQINVQIWYTGEGLQHYLMAGGHLDFLVKPIAQEQINETIETAIKIIKRKKCYNTYT